MIVYRCNYFVLYTEMNDVSKPPWKSLPFKVWGLMIAISVSVAILPIANSPISWWQRIKEIALT